LSRVDARALITALGVAAISVFEVTIIAVFDPCLQVTIAAASLTAVVGTSIGEVIVLVVTFFNALVDESITASGD
jgi:hypothetical protein